MPLAPVFGEKGDVAITTLVLIPGLISDAIVWQPLSLAVSGSMAVHAADLSQGTSITGMAQDLLNRIAGPVVPVGHSMGGRIAMEMARLAPQRVKGMALANTGHHPRREAELPKREAMIALGHKSMEELADNWLPPMVDEKRLADSVLMDALRAMVLRADADMHERQIRALIGRPDATSYMATLTCPTLLIAARQDLWSPIAQHAELAAAMPDSEITIIEDAGHFAPLERPDEVTAAITAWLKNRTGVLNV